MITQAFLVVFSSITLFFSKINLVFCYSNINEYFENNRNEGTAIQ